jgi:hypothetical protein
LIQGLELISRPDIRPSIRARNLNLSRSTPSKHIVFHVLRMETSYNYCRTFCKISRMLLNATREGRFHTRRPRANCCKLTFSVTATEPWKPCCSTSTRCAKSWVNASCHRCNIQPRDSLLCFPVIDMMCVAGSSNSFFRSSFFGANGIIPCKSDALLLVVRRFRYYALFTARCG